jgi:hypothetical protein
MERDIEKGGKWAQAEVHVAWWPHSPRWALIHFPVPEEKGFLGTFLSKDFKPPLQWNRSEHTVVEFIKLVWEYQCFTHCVVGDVLTLLFLEDAPTSHQSSRVGSVASIMLFNRLLRQSTRIPLSSFSPLLARTRLLHIGSSTHIVLPPQEKKFANKLTLVLDLDETMIHSIFEHETFEYKKFANDRKNGVPRGKGVFPVTKTTLLNSCCCRLTCLYLL